MAGTRWQGQSDVPFTLPPDANGILPDRMIAAMADAGLILPAYPFVESQIQPASLDLRLGDVAYRVRASFLPGPGATVAERIDQLTLHDLERLVDCDDADLLNGVALSVDLSGESANGFVGYRAKRHTGVVDIDRRGGYAVDDFWEAISARPDGSLILDPGEFYILASKGAVQIPPDYAP